MNARYSRVAWIALACFFVATVALANPVSDPVGDAQDAFGAGGFLPDITSVGGTQDGTTVTITIEFATAVAPPSLMATNSVAGSIELDIDQSNATGFEPDQNFFKNFPTVPNFGSDVFINLFSEIAEQGVVEILDKETFTFLGDGTLNCEGSACTITFDQSLIGASMPIDILPLVGSLAQPTDALSAPATTKAATGLTGDYNGDGAVDAIDYAIWRESLGDTGKDLAADGNGDQTVDSVDYALWRENFGSGGTPAPDGDDPDLIVASVDNSSVGPGDDTVSPEFNGAFDGDGAHFTWSIAAIPAQGGATGTTTIVGGALTVNVQQSSSAIFIHPATSGLVPDAVPGLPAAAFTTGVTFDPDSLDPFLSSQSTTGPMQTEIICAGNANAVEFNTSASVPLVQVTIAPSTEGGATPALAMECQPAAQPTSGATEGGNLVASVVVEMAALGAAGQGPVLFNCAITTSAGPADLNGDGFVNGADLAGMLANFGPCGLPCPPSCAADLNGDCIVDGADLAQLLANWTG